MEMWDQYVDLLKPAGELIAKTWAPDNKEVQAALCRHLMLNLSHGYFQYFQATPDHPEWIPYENSVFLFCSTNPDGIYYYTKVDGRGVYRVYGERGTSPVVGFATGKNILGFESPGPGYDNYDLNDLTLNDDTSFEVIFSAERPAGYTGDWLYLNPEAKFILLRQFSYDWGRERDARLAIERLDAPPLKPPMSIEETDRNFRELMGGYVERLCKQCINIERRRAGDGFINKAGMADYVDIGAGKFGDKKNSWPQAYWECVFDIAEDEALILEIDLPEQRHYWNMQVTDGFYYQVECVYRQSSLNGHQAAIDADGKFRAVLSLRDPGIANWLDTNGNTYGMMTGRWHRCSFHPLPTMTKVKLKDLRRHLPETTPVFSAEQRAEQLHRRRIGAQLRRRW